MAGVPHGSVKSLRVVELPEKRHWSPGAWFGPRPDVTFNTAYTELWRKGYLHCVGAGPAEIQQAYSWGSHASKLVQVLRTPGTPGHEQLQLTPEEFDRIVTWVFEVAHSEQK